MYLLSFCWFACLFLWQIEARAGPTYEIEAAKKSCESIESTLKMFESVVNCFPEPKDNIVKENTACLIGIDVQGNKTQLALKTCVHGKWTDTSLGKKVELRKRIVGVLIGFAICYYFCSRGGGGGGGGGGDPPPPKSPPTFSNCPPGDLQTNYYAASRETTAVVTWSTPTATDSDGTIQSEETPTQGSGSRFIGDVPGRQHTIIYKAKDNDGLTAYCQFSFTVYIRSCATASNPLNGVRNCDMTANLGSVCTYNCNDGYKLLGNSTITCTGDSSPTWSPTPPTCEKVNCPAVPTIENGNIDCAGTTAGTICQINCDTNYRISGQSAIVCQPNGTWTSTAGISCTDQRAPDISCESPQTFYADRGSNSTSVTWRLPTATDLIDPNPTVTQIEGEAQGSVFQIGSHFVKYKATDSEGNESGECNIEIRVEASTCPHPYDTLQDTSLLYECNTNSYIYGTECELSCQFHYTLNGTNLITCEVDDPNNPSPTGTWSWGSGHQPHCNRIDCPALDPPINGALTSNYAGTSLIYTMLCNENFDIIPSMGTGFNGQWICQNTGTYTPNIPVPDCVEPRSPRFVALPGELFYYSGNCSDPETAEQIKNNVQQILNDSVNPIIQTLCANANNTCGTSDLQVTCGDTTYRKKRCADGCNRPYGSTIKLQKRERRNSPSAIAEFIILVEIIVGDGQTFLEALTVTDNLLSDVVVPAIEQLIDDGDFDIVGFTLQDDSFQVPQYGDTPCEPGYRLEQINCEPCPPGNFLNSSDVCELCELGTYAEVEGMTSCTSCPTGYTTLETGRKNSSSCIELCPAGMYSSDGVVPCTSCPVGYYQSDIGQSSCIQCETGTTEFSGSSSVDQCQAFHVLVQNTNGVVSAGSVPDMDNISIMFWVKKFADLSASASIRLTSSGSDILIFHLTNANTIQVQVPGTTFDMEIGDLFYHTWMHVAVTWDTTNSELAVYLKGHLIHTESSFAASTSPLVSSGTLTLESTGTTGVYIADLHLVDAIVSESEVMSMTTNCWIERSTDVFNMSNFRDISVQGLSIQTPTFCDPIDDCETNPCNNEVIGHTCVDGINNYTCYCIEDYTGRNCETALDYCIGNMCKHGATCVSGHGTYNCTCLPGYSGDLCEDAPVDGGWSEWSEWTDCSVTCNGGTQTRTRACDSPPPSPEGIDCTGDSVETQNCNQDVCPVCPQLERGFKMTPYCITDSAGTQNCTVTCEEGFVLPASLNQTWFSCGSLTNYTWTPMQNVPDCEDAEKGSRNDLRASITTNNAIPTSDEAEAEQTISNNLANNIPCVNNNTCEVSDVTVTTVRRKRSTGSTITVTLTVIMTEMGALEIQEYIQTSYVSPSFQELIDAINDLETAAAIINSSSSSIFDVTVNGVTYTTDSSTLTLTGNVTCPTGQVATDGVCVACPEGTYYVDGYCTFCDAGTYTSSAGQTSCFSCPSGLTTSTIGSYAAAQCSESLITTTVSGPRTTTVGQNQNNLESTSGGGKSGMYIGVAIAGVALLVSISVCIFVIYKKKWIKPTRRVGSETSLQTARTPGSRPGTAVSVANVEYTEVDVAHAYMNPMYRDVSKPRYGGAAGIDFTEPTSPPPAYSERDQVNVLHIKH